MNIEEIEKFVDGYFMHYKTGIPEIDNEHRNILIKLELFKRTKDLSMGEDITNDMKNHFMLENNIMEAVNFPHAERHLDDHKNGLEKNKKMLETCVCHDCIFDFMKHIEWHDLPLFNWIVENGKQEIMMNIVSKFRQTSRP